MRLICGCCGDRFSGKQDTDHDRGYGLCPSCEKEQEEQAISEIDKSIKLLADSFSEKNRKKFLGEPRWLQEYIVKKAFEEGILQWEIS